MNKIIRKFEDIKPNDRLISDNELIVVTEIKEDVAICQWRAGDLYLYQKDLDKRKVELAPKHLQNSEPMKC